MTVCKHPILCKAVGCVSQRQLDRFWKAISRGWSTQGGSSEIMSDNSVRAERLTSGRVDPKSIGAWERLSTLVVEAGGTAGRGIIDFENGPSAAPTGLSRPRLAAVQGQVPTLPLAGLGWAGKKSSETGRCSWMATYRVWIGMNERLTDGVVGAVNVLVSRPPIRYEKSCIPGSGPMGRVATATGPPGLTKPVSRIETECHAAATR